MVCVFARPSWRCKRPWRPFVCGRGQRTSALFAALHGPFRVPLRAFLENFMVVVFHQASEIVPVADEFTITNEGAAALYVELPDVDLDELP